MQESKQQGLFRDVKCDKFQLYNKKDYVTDLFSDTKSQVSTSTISIGLSSKQFSDLKSNHSHSRKTTKKNIKSLQDTLFSNKSSLKHLVFDAQMQAKDNQTTSRTSQKHVVEQQKQLNIMYELNWLQDFQQDLIDIPALQMNQSQFLSESQRNAHDDEEKFYNPAIGFDNVLEHCMERLEEVFAKKFKKSQMFSEMLMDICKTEAHIRLRR